MDLANCKADLAACEPIAYGSHWQAANFRAADDLPSLLPHSVNATQSSRAGAVAGDWRFDPPFLRIQRYLSAGVSVASRADISGERCTREPAPVEFGVGKRRQLLVESGGRVVVGTRITTRGQVRRKRDQATAL